MAKKIFKRKPTDEQFKKKRMEFFWQQKRREEFWSFGFIAFYFIGVYLASFILPDEYYSTGSEWIVGICLPLIMILLYWLGEMFIKADMRKADERAKEYFVEKKGVSHKAMWGW